MTSPAPRLQLAAAMLHLRDELRAAGLRASVDPADADLPGLVLYPGLLDFNRLDGAYELSVDLFAVAGGVRALHALDQLDALLSTLAGLYPSLGEFRAVSVVMPSHNGGEPLPALQGTLTLFVQPTNEGDSQP